MDVTDWVILLCPAITPSTIPSGIVVPSSSLLCDDVPEEETNSEAFKASELAPSGLVSMCSFDACEKRGGGQDTHERDDVMGLG